MSTTRHDAPRLTAGTAVTTLRLLYSVNSRRRGPRRSVRESEIPLGADATASVFEPTRTPHKTLVLVHGVTGRAHRDPLLVHLARSLAGLGYRCVVPSLLHLSRFRHDASDIRTIVSAIQAAAQGQPKHPAILAFSYGASYALCAAADPSVADKCSALLGFGAYYELQEALQHQYELLLSSPDVAAGDADLTYLRYTLLASHRDQLNLSEEAWQHLEPVLVNFTGPGPLAPKLAPLVRYASHIDYAALMRSYMARDHSDSLSPNSCLHAVRCWVGLLHDPSDRFVPSQHAERIRADLDARKDTPRTMVLTTPMLSHVQVDPLRRIIDLAGLMRVLNPILSA